MHTPAGAFVQGHPRDFAMRPLKTWSGKLTRNPLQSPRSLMARCFYFITVASPWETQHAFGQNRFLRKMYYAIFCRELMSESAWSVNHWITDNHTTAGNLIPGEENDKHISRHDNNDIDIINPLTAEWALRALIDFTLCNARRFYSSMGNPLAGKGLRSVLGKPLQKNEPYSLTHCMFGAQLCKLSVHSSTSIKNSMPKNNESLPIFIHHILVEPNFRQNSNCEPFQVVVRFVAQCSFKELDGSSRTWTGRA